MADPELAEVGYEGLILDFEYARVANVIRAQHSDPDAAGSGSHQSFVNEAPTHTSKENQNIINSLTTVSDFRTT